MGASVEIELPSGKGGFAQACVPPGKALAGADRLLEALGGSDARDGWLIETHTLGCRAEAGHEGEDAWEAHSAIFDEYSSDGSSAVFGDADDGYFVASERARRLRTEPTHITPASLHRQ